MSNPNVRDVEKLETDTRYQIFLAKMSGLLKVKTRVKLKPDFIAKSCNKKWKVVPPPVFAAERAYATYK